MRYHTIELNGNTYDFRLTSQDAVKIEEQCKVKLLDYIQDYSVNAVVNLLHFMRRGADKSFTKNDAFNFFDELAENDWALEDIMRKIIFPTCQVSGLLTTSDLKAIEERFATKDQATEKPE